MRVYTASFTGISVSAAQDIFEVLTPATTVVALISCYLFQTSDYGAAEAEGLGVELRTVTTAGSGGTAITPRPHKPNDAAFAGTVTRNNTTQGGGTVTTLEPRGWNVQAGWEYTLTPEEWWYFNPSTRFVIAQTVPADALTMRGAITFASLS